MDIKFHIKKIIQNGSDSEDWMNFIDQLKHNQCDRDLLIEIYTVALNNINGKHTKIYKKLLVGLANLQSETSQELARRTFGDAYCLDIDCAVICVHYAQFEYKHNNKSEAMRLLKCGKCDGRTPKILIKKAYLNLREKKPSLFDGILDPWDDSLHDVTDTATIPHSSNEPQSPKQTGINPSQAFRSLSKLQSRNLGGPTRSCGKTQSASSLLKHFKEKSPTEELKEKLGLMVGEKFFKEIKSSEKRHQSEDSGVFIQPKIFQNNTINEDKENILVTADRVYGPSLSPFMVDASPLVNRKTTSFLDDTPNGFVFDLSNSTKKLKPEQKPSVSKKFEELFKDVTTTRIRQSSGDDGYSSAYSLNSSDHIQGVQPLEGLQHVESIKDTVDDNQVRQQNKTTNQSMVLHNSLTNQTYIEQSNAQTGLTDLICSLEVRNIDEELHSNLCTTSSESDTVKPLKVQQCEIEELSSGTKAISKLIPKTLHQNMNISTQQQDAKSFSAMYHTNQPTSGSQTNGGQINRNIGKPVISIGSNTEKRPSPPDITNNENDIGPPNLPQTDIRLPESIMLTAKQTNFPKTPQMKLHGRKPLSEIKIKSASVIDSDNNLTRRESDYLNTSSQPLQKLFNSNQSIPTQKSPTSDKSANIDAVLKLAEVRNSSRNWQSSPIDMATGPSIIEPINSDNTAFKRPNTPPLSNPKLFNVDKNLICNNPIEGVGLSAVQPQTPVDVKMLIENGLAVLGQNGFNVNPVLQQQPVQNQSKMFCVNGNMYKQIKCIGKGGSCKVYEVVSSDGHVYALKRVKLQDLDTFMIDSYLNEIQFLEKMKGNKEIVELLEWEQTSEFLLLVMEKGDTDLAITLRTHGALSSGMLKHYWKQMLLAVALIHDVGIVHADLKPANFLFVGPVLKLIDFGIANGIQANKTSVTREYQMGTLNYMPPEALMADMSHENGATRISRASDVWSLGCMLYLMVFKKTPYQHIKNQNSKMLAIQQGHTIEYKGIDDPLLLDCLQGCLKYNKRERYTIKQLLNHQFLGSA